ncbi:hypothetical protein OM954_13600 [Xanthomonas phaseoli pv. phaseoli]|nr:hypothetical protein [Xanthomonas phaseoli]KKY05821.1 hypothetical protein RN19_25550 [Xanthomonas phaseoli pv. phaseoli]UZB10813.1 hypothetical protein OM952_13160 [Xanthomonas phaseoli pv. phaseoli]UZB23409.1 hypothetical protein OM954_13600 [Xanthomonas phaseoli pv. phaseoli]
MTSFTAVDLSRLQAPDLIESLDFETIFSEALAQFQKLMPEFSALTEADPVYKLVQLFAARELLLRQRANDKAQQTVIPPPISRRQKWNFLVPFPEEVP